MQCAVVSGVAWRRGDSNMVWRDLFSCCVYGDYRVNAYDGGWNITVRGGRRTSLIRGVY